jgi:hypothetical protein
LTQQSCGTSRTSKIWPVCAAYRGTKSEICADERGDDICSGCMKVVLNCAELHCMRESCTELHCMHESCAELHCMHESCV